MTKGRSMAFAERIRKDCAVFTVRDNGGGISDDVLPNIFSPAPRGKAHTADNRRNMGIGLSVCSSIVKAHGGTMSAANGAAGGAVFRFALPMEEFTTEDMDYDFIIRQLWGAKAKNDNQILRVNMANIRMKIEKNPAQPEYIFTEIGVGYRMVDPE